MDFGLSAFLTYTTAYTSYGDRVGRAGTDGVDSDTSLTAYAAVTGGPPVRNASLPALASSRDMRAPIGQTRTIPSGHRAGSPGMPASRRLSGFALCWRISLALISASRASIRSTSRPSRTSACLAL